MIALSCLTVHVLASSFIAKLWPPWPWVLILSQKGSLQPMYLLNPHPCANTQPWETSIFYMWLIHPPGCVMKLHIRWGSAACAHLWKSSTRRKRDLCCFCFSPSMLVAVCYWGDGFWGGGNSWCSCGTTKKKKELLSSLLLLWWFSCKPGTAVIKSHDFLLWDLCKREWKLLDRLLYSKHCCLSEGMSLSVHY